MPDFHPFDDDYYAHEFLTESMHARGKKKQVEAVARGKNAYACAQILHTRSHVTSGYLKKDDRSAVIEAGLLPDLASRTTELPEQTSSYRQFSFG